MPECTKSYLTIVDLGDDVALQTGPTENMPAIRQHKTRLTWLIFEANLTISCRNVDVGIEHEQE